MRRYKILRILYVITLSLLISILFRAPVVEAVRDMLTVLIYFLTPIIIKNYWCLIVGVLVPLLRFLIKLQVYNPTSVLFFIILGDVSLISISSLLYNKGRWVSFIGIILSSLTRFLVVSRSVSRLIDNHSNTYITSMNLLWFTILGGILAFIAIPQVEREIETKNELYR
ncbi:MAG: hypothetical protein ACP5K2_06260 [bacterium]